MLSLPLHHAYTVSGLPRDCTETLADELETLLQSIDKPVSIDKASTDTMTVTAARRLVERGQKRARGEVHCVIRGFQTMTLPTQNTLLKVLEEPADGIHFFLVTPAVDDLLETVRSRTTRLDICDTNQDTSGQREKAKAFLAADGLPQRLEIAQSVAAANQLDAFVSSLVAVTDPKQHAGLRTALHRTSQWLRHSGKSASQLAEYIAIASVAND